jgi:hypothetical protein
MTNIYYLLTLVLVAIGSAYVSRLYPRIKTWFLNVINKRRNEIDRRIEQLEFRVKLHESKDSTYLHKFDLHEVKFEEVEEQIDNLAKTMSRRTKNDRDMIRREVKEYLKQLQK